MLKTLEEGIWSFETGREGPSVCIAFGVHDNERPPIDAGLAFVKAIEAGEVVPQAGSLLLVHANLRATAEDERWSKDGVDLNRCFSNEVLAREPELYEEHRARTVVAALEQVRAEVLVDFHCTVEPGERFLMQHPEVERSDYRAVYGLLAAKVLLSDPDLNFGGVSLDEWMSTRDRVGICYETGWLGDPDLTPESVLAEMRNVLVGTGVLAGKAVRHAEKRLLRLEGSLLCKSEGFQWAEGIGVNLQALPAGTRLGAYADGEALVLEEDATLIFPKKRPELVQPGKALVMLARSLRPGT